MISIRRAIHVPIVLLLTLLLCAACGGGSGGDSTDNDPPDNEDLCAGITCSGYGQCVVENGAATCDCDSGYTADGQTCVENPSTGPWPAPGLLSAPAPCPECDDSLGQQYYVGPVQTSGDGSLSQPFATIQEAVNLAQPGDTVYVLPGTYTLTHRIQTVRDGTADRRICIRAYDPQNRPVLERWTGDGVETREVCADSSPYYQNYYGGEIFLVRHQYIVIDGFVMDGHYTADSFLCRYAESDLYGDGVRTRSYRVLVAFAHYGICREGTSDEITYGYNADHAIMRNCDIGYNIVDGVQVAADDVLIENTEIHHSLRGDFDSPIDAHCVAISHARDVTLRNMNLHQCTGDLLQADPDIDNDCGTQQWDNVTIEHSRLWTGPLLAEDAPHAQYNVGETVGENGVDTKTFEHPDYHSLPRPNMTIRNVEAFGFDRSDFVSNRSVFNIKYRVDWLLDGITVHDNQWAFRIRGGVGNETQGSAHATLTNIVAYGNDGAARIERDIEELKILNSTFGENTQLFVHADCDLDPCYDEAGYQMENTLFLASDLPTDATSGLANLAVDASCFTDSAGHDYSLLTDCPAVDAGETLGEVTHDIMGEDRPQGTAYDVGAFESH